MAQRTRRELLQIAEFLEGAGQQSCVAVHAPGEYRSDTVRNTDAWAHAFDVKPGDKLYLKPEQRVRIW